MSDPTGRPWPRRLAASLVVLAGVVGLMVWWSRPEPIPVTLERVGRGRVEAVLANTRAGEIEACQRAKLSTLQGGRIEFLGVKEGDHVEAGQVLLRLWNEDQAAQLRLAESQRDSARLRVGDACNGAENASREAARQAALRRQGFVSPAREEQARFEAAARNAACAAARGDAVAAEARVRATAIDQRRTTLVAPFPGTIAKITGELGEYSTPSPIGIMTPPAIDLIDERCLYVKAPMDEVDAPRIHVGQPARIRVDALPNQQFTGRVRRLAPYVTAVEKQARTVDVEVDFDRQQEARGLLVGYSTDIEIVLDVREDVLRVPTGAIRDGRFVLVYRSEDGRLEERSVRAGLSSWEFTEVLDGLAEGDRIVISLGREGIKAGAKVTVNDPADAPKS
ncbi:MAG: efflux RND transporter periplasmic adaptor subunit [Zoogloeaceae bacterium]|nr:efflux RND transporter periplasmic adaptor subunit [Zoogloeaceae bacterium]